MRTKTSGQGRPKGAPNKITRTVKEAFEHVFNDLQSDEEHPAHLKNWAKASPSEFYRVAARLIPNEINATFKGSLVAAIKGLPVVEPPRKD